MSHSASANFSQGSRSGSDSQAIRHRAGSRRRTRGFYQQRAKYGRSENAGESRPRQPGYPRVPNMAGRRQTLILDDPRDPELEAGLADDDAAAWLRFGAWLVEQGSPRGAVVLRELDGAAVPADDAGLRVAYSAIHRCSAAAQLARQESWQFEWR